MPTRITLCRNFFSSYFHFTENISVIVCCAQHRSFTHTRIQIYSHIQNRSSQMRLNQFPETVSNVMNKRRRYKLFTFVANFISHSQRNPYWQNKLSLCKIIFVFYHYKKCGFIFNTENWPNNFWIKYQISCQIFVFSDHSHERNSFCLWRFFDHSNKFFHFSSFIF